MSEAGGGHRRIGWAIAVWAGLEGGASGAAAQGAAIVSPVTQVRLVAIVPPRVVPAAVARPSPIVWRAATGTGHVSITLSANTPYWLIALCDERGASGRIWVEGQNGRLVEVIEAKPVVVRRGSGAEGSVVVPFRLRLERDEGVVPPALPVRFDVLVDPAL